LVDWITWKSLIKVRAFLSRQLKYLGMSIMSR